MNTEKVSYSKYVIQYTLKDGSKVTREYSYNIYAILDLVERIYAEEEFRTAIHPLFSLEKTNLELKAIDCYSPISPVRSVIMAKEKMEEIIATYREE